MENIKREKMIIKILTPTYIGGAENKNLSNKDYFLSENGKELNIIDTAKLMKYLMENNLYDNFMTMISENKNITNILNEIGAKDYQEKIVKEKLNIETIVYEKGKINLNNINTFIKDSEGNPYIPASSLKGFITTAISYNYIINNKYKFENFKFENFKFDIRNNKKLKVIWNNIQKIVFKQEKFVDGKRAEVDLRRFINISDAFPKDKVSTLITAKEDFSVTNKGTKISKLPIYREYLLPDSVFEFEISMKYDELKNLGLCSINDLLNMLENYTNKAIELEEKLNDIAKKEGILTYRTFDDSLVPNMILGGGSGYFSKTLLSALFNDIELKNLLKNMLKKGNHKLLDTVSTPRTLKLAKYNSNYYFVGMTRLEEEKC